MKIESCEHSSFLLKILMTILKNNKLHQINMTNIFCLWSHEKTTTSDWLVITWK